MGTGLSGIFGGNMAFIVFLVFILLLFGDNFPCN